MRRLHLTVSLLVVVSLGAFAAPALAASRSPAVSDCVANARLTRTYTVSELQNALATMPTDVKQYTDCYDVIDRALLAQLGKLHAGRPASSSTSSGGSFLPTPLLIILILLVLAAGGFGVLALQRRRHRAGPL